MLERAEAADTYSSTPLPLSEAGGISHASASMTPVALSAASDFSGARESLRLPG